MKYLVVYYSRTGTTKRIGEELAEALRADIDAIYDKKSRDGVIGWLRAGWDALREKTTEIQVQKDPEEYDLIVIGTPIWSGKMTPAIRTYLRNYDLSNKKTAFFTTQGADKPVKAITEMKKMVVASESVEVLSIRQDDVKANRYETLLLAFVESLKK